MIRVLRARDRVASRWKNGGGATTEVVTFPPDSDMNNFDWRISIAEIRSSGPFSAFRGIQRHLAMLKGRLLLKIAGQDALELTTDSSPVSFPGDVETQAELIGDWAMDLNVMVRREVFAAKMTRRTFAGSMAINTDAAATVIFPLAAAVISESSKEVTLAFGDALLAEEATTLTSGSEVECYWIEIIGRRRM